MTLKDRNVAVLAEVMGIVMVCISRSTDTMPEAIDFYDHVIETSRKSLKRDWDTLRDPRLSDDFESGLAKLIDCVRKIKAGEMI